MMCLKRRTHLETINYQNQICYTIKNGLQNQNPFGILSCPDCFIYSNDGTRFKIHKFVLLQTKFLREIIKSASCDCKCSLEDVTYIFLPDVSTRQLRNSIQFLYYGYLNLNLESEVDELKSTLSTIFGFPEDIPLSKDDVQEICCCLVCDQLLPVSQYYEHLCIHISDDLEEVKEDIDQNTIRPFTCVICGENITTDLTETSTKAETYDCIKKHYNHHIDFGLKKLLETKYNFKIRNAEASGNKAQEPPPIEAEETEVTILKESVGNLEEGAWRGKLSELFSKQSPAQVPDADGSDAADLSSDNDKLDSEDEKSSSSPKINKRKKLRSTGTERSCSEDENCLAGGSDKNEKTVTSSLESETAKASVSSGMAETSDRESGELSSSSECSQGPPVKRFKIGKPQSNKKRSSDASKKSESSTNSHSKGKMICKKCQKAVKSSLLYLNTHFILHHDEVFNHVHLQPQSDGHYLCPECEAPKKFRGLSGIQQHMMINHDYVDKYLSRQGKKIEDYFLPMKDASELL